MVAGPGRQKYNQTHVSGRILNKFLIFIHNRMIAKCGNYCIDHGCIDAINCVELAEAHSRRQCLCATWLCWWGLSVVVGQQSGMVTLLPRVVL